MMLRLPHFRSVTCLVAGLAFLFGVNAANTQAQQRIPARRLITQVIDDGVAVRLPGNTRPEANAANDRGIVSDSLPMEHLQLQLQLPAEKQQELDQFISDLQNPASPNFHKWLTSEQFKQEFSLAPVDIAAITGWLQSHGFAVNVIYPRSIDFSGTAGQVRDAFKTEIHTIEANGERHIANVSDPQIPAALVPVVAGVVSMNDFMPHPLHRRRTNDTVGNGNYAVVPADLATIYNFNPVFTKGISGQGQTIVVVEDTDVYSTADWSTFRSVLGLSGYASASFMQAHPAPPSGTNNCSDPGANADDAEAILDAEWASAGAPSAAIELVSCLDTTTFGGFIALQNLLNASGTPPGIVSISYGESEAVLSAANNVYINALYEQAVAEGVSVFVSSGDQGAASSDGGARDATHGVSISGFTSTPYNVSVGGTDFGDTYAGTTSTYWNSADTAMYGSAKSYIPEIPWNDSCAGGLLTAYFTYLAGYGSGGFCNSSTGETYYLNTVAGSGGPSGCATGTSTNGVVSGSCAGYAKPSWQSVFGNPSDGVRDIPDVSLFAANGLWGHYYVVCYSDSANGGVGCAGNPNTWNGFGGTSVSSPIMASVQALINQTVGSNAGDPNAIYYSLAAAEYGSAGNTSCNSTLGNGAAGSCVFYDITQGDMDVVCKGSHNCYLPSGTYGVLSKSDSSYQLAFGTTSGWDFATGIGSVNVANLVNGWPRWAAVSVPNVVGDTQAAAATAITGAGLIVGTVTTASSSTVASGNVISESPAAGTSVSPGSAVNLVVSTGPPPVLVPSVVGDTQAAATTAITGAGLIVGTVTTAASSTVASGSVISEAPAAGTSVASGSAVTLVVSTGPAGVVCPCTIWSSSAVPSVVDSGAGAGVELGVKFTSSSNGTITGVRFYKSAANTGTHVGNLWSSTGALLATATFSNETSSGWQQVNFSSPVNITAGTVYVASYYTGVSHFSIDSNAFATAGVNNPPLQALANGASGGNGVYMYGSTSAFPGNTYNASNYWVDVVFAQTTSSPLASIAVTPANPTVNVGATQQFAATGTYQDSSTANITSQVTWNSSNTTVATINSAGLAAGQAAGNSNITAALNGITSNSSGLTVQTPPLPTCPCTIWSSGAVPSVVDSGAGAGVELGVKFTSSSNGTITGVRFYKSAANTGTHVGNLWSSTGTLLATATFSNETSLGWQQVNFSSPVTVTAGTVYVASYYTSVSHFSIDSNAFATAGVNNPPLQALANGASGGNGVYMYGSTSAFPGNTYNASNYWVDVVFAQTTSSPLASIAVTPANPTVNVGATQQFAATGTYQDSSMANITSQVTWNSSNATVATINSAGLATGQAAGNSNITAALNGITSNIAGLTVQAPPPPACPCTIWSSSAVPSIVDSGAGAGVELGVKFTSSSGGTITGVRFYKSAANTGTHVGNLWSSTGTLLATATFSNETSSGWQQVNFSSPVNITAGTVYVASYYTSVSHFSIDLNAFASAGVSNPPLQALENGASGGNGVYMYSGTSAFPSNTYSASNYWVDVVLALP
jgi:hypothetical protein